MSTRTKPTVSETRRTKFLRASLAAGALMLGGFSVINTLATVIFKADPARAHVLAPNNGAVTAALAFEQFATSPSNDDSAPAVRLARKALRQDPTSVDALAVLGLQAELKNDASQARKVFGYSRELSRRELRAQIWAIEESVRRGDIVEALHHYDMALRTSVRAQELLFPILAASLDESSIRSALLQLMKEKPAWGESFIGYVATSGVDPRAGMDFFRESRKAGVKIAPDWSAGLVNALIATESYEDAWAYFTSFRSPAHRNRSRDPNFELEGAVRTPFDWITSQEARMSVAILPGEEGGLVDFSIPSGVGGLLVQQLLMLPPGNYRLDGRSAGIDQPVRSRPYWRLTCQDGRELGRVTLPGFSLEEAAFSGRFTVPAGCFMQRLQLIAKPSDSVSGLVGQITRAELRRENQRSK